MFYMILVQVRKHLCKRHRGNWTGDSEFRIDPVGLRAKRGLMVLAAQRLCWAHPQGWRLPYISGMMKTEISSPEPRRSLVILQPLSLSTPRARITRSCAAIVYLANRGNSNDRIRISHRDNERKTERKKGSHLWRSSGSQLARKVVTASATSWLERTSHRPSVPITRTSSAPCSYCVRLYTFTCRPKHKAFQRISHWCFIFTHEKPVACIYASNNQSEPEFFNLTPKCNFE